MLAGRGGVACSLNSNAFGAEGARAVAAAVAENLNLPLTGYAPILCLACSLVVYQLR